MLKVISMRARKINELAARRAKKGPKDSPRRRPIAPMSAHAAIQKSATGNADSNLTYHSSSVTFTEPLKKKSTQK
jgi:hypothetical protein